jgi:hypothetical protein
MFQYHGALESQLDSELEVVKEVILSRWFSG